MIYILSHVGYGNIAPRTSWGRIVCIAYALVGIPLMLLCLANLGDALAKFFRFLYTEICCCGFCRPSVLPSRAQSFRDPSGPTDQGKLSRQGSVHEAWKTQYQARNKAAVANDSDLTILVEENEDDEKAIKEEEEEEEMYAEEDEGYDNDDDDDGEQFDIDNADYNEISVPLTIILGVIAGYIFFGTVLFGLWEGWDPLTAAYFCFITISTIGFGDVVPGFATSGATSTSAEYQLLGTSLYMLLGMATLSMCFTLVQDQMVVKFRLLTKKIGVKK